jgi:hypothetical protein
MSSKKSEAVQALENRGVGVIDDQADIQLVSESDLQRLAAEESFMQEIMTIRLASTTDQNASPYVVLTCNGVADRVVVPRGKTARVKRMHVEVLARMHEIRYTQRPPVAGDLESGNYLYPSVAHAYPFEVLHDPNPAGSAWLENILAEPVR